MRLEQPIKHLELNKLHATHQGGYRVNHSCETASLTIYNDLLCKSDLKIKVVQLLLDLSAAFYTVGHKILFSILKDKSGISGDVQNWLRSYLDGRSFIVTHMCAHRSINRAVKK